MLSLVSEIWFIAISITVSIETVVAHHLQNVSGKSGWNARKIGFTQIYSVQIWCKKVQTKAK